MTNTHHMMRSATKLFMFAAGLLLCSLTSAAQNKFKKVTSQDEIVEYGVYILVCENQEQAMGGIDKNGNGTKVSVTIENNTITTDCNTAGKPYSFWLKKVGGKWRLYNRNFNSINIAEKDEAKLEWSNNYDYGQWNITINAEGLADITNTKSATRSLRCDTYFKNYSNVSNVCLYRQYETMTIGSKEGFGTHYTDKAYFMPTATEGATVSEANGDKLTFNYIYPEGSIVPPQTPLLLRGNMGDHDYFVAETIDKTSNPTAPGTNYLRGSAQDETTSTDMTGDVFYYKFSYFNGKDLGFYWGAENGGAFLNTAGKAYLVLPAPTGEAAVHGFAFDDAVTGIHTPQQHPAQEDAIYTLSGVRIKADRLPKGIYIRNGRKIIIK